MSAAQPCLPTIWNRQCHHPALIIVAVHIVIIHIVLHQPVCCFLRLPRQFWGGIQNETPIIKAEWNFNKIFSFGLQRVTSFTDYCSVYAWRTFGHWSETKIFICQFLVSLTHQKWDKVIFNIGEICFPTWWNIPSASRSSRLSRNLPDYRPHLQNLKGNVKFFLSSVGSLISF